MAKAHKTEVERQVRLPSDLVKQGWCQNVPAQTDNGRGVEWFDKSACSWCLGAAIKVSNLDPERQREYWRIFSEMTGFIRMSGWNDDSSRKKEHVVSLTNRIEKEMGLV